MVERMVVFAFALANGWLGLLNKFVEILNRSTREGRQWDSWMVPQLETNHRRRSTGGYAVSNFPRDPGSRRRISLWGENRSDPPPGRVFFAAGDCWGQAIGAWRAGPPW
jgi:hypothetical protein